MRVLNHVSMDGQSSLRTLSVEVWTSALMTPGWDPPLARASGFCSRLEIAGCITQETVMCGLFTRGLQAVGSKRHELLLRNGDCTAHVAVTPFTNFLITKKKK